MTGPLSPLWVKSKASAKDCSRQATVTGIETPDQVGQGLYSPIPL